MKLKDTMRRQYDMTGGVRVKYAGRRKGDVVMVPIAPDVAAAFPDAEAVNEPCAYFSKPLRMWLRPHS
jgi:hypothetical protein